MSMSLSWQSALASVPIALLEGALVMLPSAGGLRHLSRLRSPLWTAVLPASIIVGTFGLLIFPWAPTGVLLAAAVTTPLLAAAAVLFVVRARRFVLPAAFGAAVAAALCTGGLGHLGMSIVLALACLTVGVTLHRLIPSRWLLVGVLMMAVTDVALLACPYGYQQTAVLAAASNGFHGPQFTGATVGAITIGYPDLCLAALLGAYLAGRPTQRPAALILVALMVGYDSMLAPGVLLPATVPIALTLIIVSVVPSWRLAGRRRPTPARVRSRSEHAQGPSGECDGSEHLRFRLSSGARPHLTRSYTQRLTGRQTNVTRRSAIAGHRNRRIAAGGASPPDRARGRPTQRWAQNDSPHRA